MEVRKKVCEHVNIEQSLLEIIDDYEHKEPNLEYILENVLQENDVDDSAAYRKLADQYNSILLNRCECCNSNKCNFGSCAHGGNYIKAEKSNELVLNQTAKHDLIYECNSMCKCDKNRCENRLVQFGPRKNLRIIESALFGSKGLATIEDIPCGGFICEYAGELLIPQEAGRRIADNVRNCRMNYILCLNEISQHEEGMQHVTNYKQTTIVDPSLRGNIGRYLNHSCEPNCEILSVRVDCPIPKIGIFAKRHIQAGEELCFHYGGNLKNRTSHLNQPLDFAAKRCLCASSKCGKVLPNEEFFEIVDQSFK